jgi:hypothetical protein
LRAAEVDVVHETVTAACPIPLIGLDGVHDADPVQPSPSAGSQDAGVDLQVERGGPIYGLS